MNYRNSTQARARSAAPAWQAPRGTLILAGLLGSSLLACATPAAKPAATEAAIPPAPVVEKQPASSAPSLVALPSASDPLVSIRLMFRTGSIDDPTGQEGITHLTAGVMSEASQSMTSAQLLEALFPMAGSFTVQVDKEATTFIGRVHKDNLEPFTRIIAEVVTHPRFDPADFERLRTEAVKDIQVGLRSDNDEELGKVALEAFLYPNHPYGRPIEGLVHTLKALKLEDIKAHAQKVFTRDRLTIGLAGGYPTDFPARLEGLLAGLPATGAPRVSLPAPGPAQRAEVEVVQKETPTTAISFGFSYGVTRADPVEYAAMRLVSSYLGEHRQGSGVLFQRLREARGLNYGDYVYAEAFQQEGWNPLARHNIPRTQQFFSVWIRPVPAVQGQFALRAAMREFDELVKSGLSQEAFEQTRSFLVGYSRLWEQTADRRLGYALDGKFYGALPDLEAFRQTLKGLTLEQVNAVVKKHLTPPGLRVVVVTKDAEGMAAALKAGTPSPIRYSSPKAAWVMQQDKLIEGYDLRIDPERVKVVKAEELFE